MAWILREIVERLDRRGETFQGMRGSVRRRWVGTAPLLGLGGHRMGECGSARDPIPARHQSEAEAVVCLYQPATSSG
jgi:hypothetical protein